MNTQSKIRPLPANADNRPPGFNGTEMAETYRERRRDESAAAPMETDGEAGGAHNRGAAQPRPDLPPTQSRDERDRTFPRKGRAAFIGWIALGLVIAVALAIFAA